KPLIAINHLEGHALTARLTDGLDFPYLLLLVSGGHTQIVAVRGVGDYQRWATTIDDALGEAFDKTAKMLGLPYPGGPNVEKAAATGDVARFAQDVADICASFQAAVADALEDRVSRALNRFRQEFPGEMEPALVVAGGVAANRTIKATLETLCEKAGFAFVASPHCR
ncbi:MAG: tRNA (adenosine(37)-N6)-threonylcarbamoyltransferase complex transferase subunit TsaD, partial [Mesorhizobium sp.]